MAAVSIDTSVISPGSFSVECEIILSPPGLYVGCACCLRTGLNWLATDLLGLCWLVNFSDGLVWLADPLGGVTWLATGLNELFWLVGCIFGAHKLKLTDGADWAEMIDTVSSSTAGSLFCVSSTGTRFWVDCKAKQLLYYIIVIIIYYTILLHVLTVGYKIMTNLLKRYRAQS